MINSSYGHNTSISVEPPLCSALTLDIYFTEGVDLGISYLPQQYVLWIKTDNFAYSDIMVRPSILRTYSSSVDSRHINKHRPARSFGLGNLTTGNKLGQIVYFKLWANYILFNKLLWPAQCERLWSYIPYLLLLCMNEEWPLTTKQVKNCSFAEKA